MEYPDRIDRFSLGKYGSINFVQWLFGDQETVITEQWIDEWSAFIPRGSFAIDIGAWTGDTTIPMALCVGYFGKVLAFEPGSESIKILRRNVSNLNYFNRVVDILPYAVTDKPGPQTFWYTDPGFINGGQGQLDITHEGCGNKFPLEVTGVRLDEFLLTNYCDCISNLSFVKIDTEGYDSAILRANASLFKARRPVIQVEVYPFLSIRERQELMNAVKDLGYTWTGGESVFMFQDPKPKDVLCKPQ
jgi:FkbM family methyltransferase